MVTLEITPEWLVFWNIDMKFVVEPGKFQIAIGPNSVDLQAITLRVKSGKRILPVAVKKTRVDGILRALLSCEFA